VVESILFNHPLAPAMLDLIERAVKKLRDIVEKRQSGAVVDALKEARNIFDASNLRAIENDTAQLDRLRLDVSKCAFTFNFTQEQNTLGLLARILYEFDQRGVNKTTTIAQTSRDGGCTIIIGVRGLNPAALEAERVIKRN
jgi:hypothetical protein